MLITTTNYQVSNELKDELERFTQDFIERLEKIKVKHSIPKVFASPDYIEGFTFIINDKHDTINSYNYHKANTG